MIRSANQLSQWIFLLRHAHEFAADELRGLLPEIEFHQAIGTIETIAAKSVDRMMDDQREKAIRDYEWAIAGARQEGTEVGLIAGKVQTLQELLGAPVSADAELLGQTVGELHSKFCELQARLRSRMI